MNVKSIGHGWRIAFGLIGAFMALLLIVFHYLPQIVATVRGAELPVVGGWVWVEAVMVLVIVVSALGVVFTDRMVKLLEKFAPWIKK